MRLDKFLKVSRLIKRRTVANDFCDAGSVWINGKPAKAAAEVKAGDEITLNFGNRTVVVRVETVPTKHVAVQEAASLYQIISEIRTPYVEAPSDE